MPDCLITPVVTPALPEAALSSGWVYTLLLAGGVGLGLPMGAAVVAAGALFGGVHGIAIVIAAQAIGLTVNWHLCRTWCRGWLVRRLDRNNQARWLMELTQQPISFPVLVLLRLAPLPMTLVSACCALSATNWRFYAMASTTLLLRFSLMVQAGSMGAEAISGRLSVLSALMTAAAAAAALTLAWLSGRRLRQLISQRHSPTTPLQKEVPGSRNEIENGSTR